MEITMTECKHGIPLVNGIGCMICSNRHPVDKVYVGLTTAPRETRINKVLSQLSEMVDEVPAGNFI